MSDRFERAMNVLSLLLATAKPLSFPEIAEKVPGYPPGRDARRRAFERDKALLRMIGVPLEVVEPTSFLAQADAGYTVDKQKYYLQNLDLAPDELGALRLAAAYVGITEKNVRALRKLGDARMPSVERRVWTANVEQVEGICEAAAERRLMNFTYKGESREVIPLALAAKGGFWYLVGHDNGKRGKRTFRVDRIEGEIEFGKPQDFHPAGLLNLERELASFSKDNADEFATVAFAPEMASLASRVAVAPISVRDDGWIVARIKAPTRDELVRQVLSFLDKAELVEPQDLRDELVARLQVMASGVSGSLETKGQSGRTGEGG